MVEKRPKFCRLSEEEREQLRALLRLVKVLRVKVPSTKFLMLRPRFHLYRQYHASVACRSASVSESDISISAHMSSGPEIKGKGGSSCANSSDQKLWDCRTGSAPASSVSYKRKVSG